MVLTTSMSSNGTSSSGSIFANEQQQSTLSVSMISSSSSSSSSQQKRRRTRDVCECMEVGSAVGTGTYGVVYKAIDKTDEGRPAVALKKIKMERETQGFPVTAIREIKILNLMNHENIVKLREIITYDKENEDENKRNELKNKGISLGDVFMVFEYVEYDLAGLLKSPTFNITSDMIKSYMHQLLEGVNYLHEKRILHRDIKSANLLVSKNNVLKIADWGLARTAPPPNHKLTVPVVTLWYRSPELVFGTKQYSTEVDIWSVG
jgi:serine/threonine protein kinase